MPYPQYAVGCAALLRQVAKAILPEINTALAAMVHDAPGGQPTTVTLKMGRLRSVSCPTLTIIHIGEDAPDHSGSRDFTRTLRFKFIFLVPQIGDDLPENFEMARQVTSDILVCRLDDTDLLTPSINAGAFGIISSMLAQRGSVSDILEFTMPDGVTVAEGFQLPWQAQFALTRLPAASQ